MLGFMEKLVSASNLNNYYSDSVVSSWIVEGEEIVCSFVGSPNVNSYIQELGNEMIDLLIGSKKLAGMLCDLQSLPFSIDGVNLVYDKDKEVTELRVKITPGVERNFKLLFAMSFMKFIENVMIDRFEQNPKTTKDQMEAIRAFVQSITVGRVGEPINDLYSICLDGIKSANPLMNKALRNVYVETLKTQLENCGVDSSEFFELNDNVLSIKDITDVRIVNAIAERTAWRVARNFAKKGDKNSKVTNITDVLRREILQLTGVDGKDGILIDGYDCDAFIGENGTDLVNDFPLILKIAGSDGKLRDITREEAFRINAASEMFGGLLIDIRGHAKGERYTKSKEPVYGILHERFADLIPYLMQGPIACNSIVYKETNETITYFDYAVNLGNLFKSREHSNLSDDLGHILLPKFYKDGYLDKKSLLEANNYIWQCLLKSKFGVEGYDMPELAEFVNQKIKEWRTIEEHQDQNIVIPKDENIVISKAAGFRPSSLAVPSGSKVGGSRGSLSSGNSDSSSRSVSPMPRNSSDSSLSSGLPSMPFFGASCVDDLATAGTSAPVQMPTVMEASIETSGKYGQSSQILPSIEITGVADENSKSSYDKPVPSFERSNSAPGDMVNQLVKQAASEPKVAPEDNKKTPSKPEPPLSEVNSVKVDQPGQAIPKVAELSHVGKVRHKMKEESQKEKPKKKGGCIVM